MKKIFFLLLFTIASYGQAVFDEGIQITGNANSATATKVNVQETDGKVNTQTIKTGFNKNIGLGGSDVVGANTLLNQYSTTPLDWTATAYNSGQVVFYVGKQWISKMVTAAGDVPAVSSKWEEITFDALANKSVNVDQTIIDGSTNAVSSNAVFDGLALKSNIGHTHVASQITDLSKASVGLGNVDNTSDLNKPISTASQTALNLKLDKSLLTDFNKAYISPYTTGSIRNSEGDILRLASGKLLAVYSRFYATSTDFSPSVISFRISNDTEGNSWGKEAILSPDIATLNILSASLLRVDASSIDCFFLVRNSNTDLKLYKSRSTDDGVTWSAASMVVSKTGYNIVLNASVRRGNSNRIIIPIANVADVNAGSLNFGISTLYSDDNGLTYSESNVLLLGTSVNASETSFVKLSGNNLLLVIRSTSGYLYFSNSADNGTTWGVPYQSSLKSTASPAQIVNYNGTLIAFHNPNTLANKRNPLTISKSVDNGLAWSKITDLNIAGDPQNYSYSYPSLTLDGDNILVSYYEITGDGGQGLKFANINVPDLLAGEKPTSAVPNNTTLRGLSFDKSEIIQPVDSPLSAFGKLQAQINKRDGAPFKYQGVGAGVIIKNDRADKVMTSSFLEFQNTDGASVSRIGFLSALQNLYFYSLKDIRLQAPVVRSLSDRFIIGADVDATSKLQVTGDAKITGTISASPATTANQVVVKSQLDAVAARPYKVYTALLSQTGTNAPTATVLENTLGGTIVWSRNNVGVYLATLNGSFIANKTVVFVTPANNGNNYFLYGKPSNINSCTLQVFNTVGQSTDGLFTDVSIEIRVYN